jgi:hypothetical protein
MTKTNDRQSTLVKLIRVCDDLGDVVTKSEPAARYDLVVIPQTVRLELSNLRDNLAEIIRRLQEKY